MFSFCSQPTILTASLVLFCLSCHSLTEDEEWNERLQILEDARNLKKVAEFFLQPEQPVKVDSTACARAYPYASELQETWEEAEDRAEILADAAALKATAVQYLQPELPVAVDALASARCYPFAPELQETFEEAEERAQILADAAALKTTAVQHLKPELPVVTSDPFAKGRNFFSRFSADEFEDEETRMEREAILADAQALKSLAVDYLKPELPVVTSDPCATGRNFYSRYSADEFEDEDTMDDCDEILADALALKKLAVDYLHPENPVEIDDLASCRSYFDRAPAPIQEDFEDAEERAAILSEAQALKKLATDFMCPELPCVTTDPFATARNFYSRPSAEDYEDEADAEERTRILEDMKQLKKLAVDYLQPELPCVTTDPCASGRNVFTRPSADEYEDDSEERTRIMEEMAQLKKVAADYMHPERPVATDATATASNYFDRTNVLQESVEESEERARIMEDMASLKKLATDYLKPELPCKTTDPCVTGRNWFGRSSAPEQESFEAAEERNIVLEEAASLKKYATDYLHPEKPVESTDAYRTGRNFFDRASAPGHAEQIHSQDTRHLGHSEDHDVHITHHAYDYGHYDVHDHGHDHSSVSDHFEMDEDISSFRDSLRQSIAANEPFKGEHPMEAVEEGEEGKLSRSPSSVMLFEGETA